jgi:hypothetical protein
MRDLACHWTWEQCHDMRNSFAEKWQKVAVSTQTTAIYIFVPDMEQNIVFFKEK